MLGERRSEEATSLESGLGSTIAGRGCLSNRGTPSGFRNILLARKYYYNYNWSRTKSLETLAESTSSSQFLQKRLIPLLIRQTSAHAAEEIAQARVPIAAQSGG